MIHALKVENFFSINEEQSINFVISKNAPEFLNFRCSLPIKEKRLPVVIGLYGANASGKSNILRAMVNICLFAVHSFSLPTQQIITLFQPFRTNAWIKKPTKLSITFDGQLTADSEHSLFRYDLHISHDLNNHLYNKEVAYEALSCSTGGKFLKLFEREGKSIKFGKKFGLTDNDSRVLAIRPNASVISTFVQLNHQYSIDISNLINRIETNILGFEKNQINHHQLMSTYFTDSNLLNELNSEIKRLDIGIENISIEHVNGNFLAKLEHVGLDSFIHIFEESMGTRKFIEIFPKIYNVLKKGSVAIIDELDTDLHPLLVPEILRWFYDNARNVNNAQLIFTAHNPTLLDELEKEQIIFTEKGSEQATILYSASDIKGLRREPSLMKKYLSGELGAIPQIG